MAKNIIDQINYMTSKVITEKQKPLISFNAVDAKIMNR